MENKVNEILEFAIAREEESYQFYTGLAEKMDKEYMKKVFQSFAKEELGHKAKLLGIKEGKEFKPTDKKIMDLKIADYVVDIDPDQELDYQGALIVAMKKEKAAFKLYTDLAQAAADEKLMNTLLGLAQEEAKHKLRFEIEYDNIILTEN